MCALVAKTYPDKVVRWCTDGEFLAIFLHPVFQRAACSTFQTQTCILKAKFHYDILVPDRPEAGRRQVRSWSQTCSELEFGLS